MNIYEKMNLCKLALLNNEMKKSGKNNFTKYNYFSMEDFLPNILQLCQEQKLYTSITFTLNEAILKIINIDEPSEILVFQSPFGSADLKGCHEVQNIGAVETYQRRYLYITAFDIIEHDIIDSGEPVKEESEKDKLISEIIKLTEDNKTIVGATAINYNTSANLQKCNVSKLDTILTKLNKHIEEAKTNLTIQTVEKAFNGEVVKDKELF